MDFSYLDTISDGDKDFIAQFVSTFKSNTFDLINSIKSAHQEQRFDDMKKLAHKIKPSLLMLNLECTHVALDIMDDPHAVSENDLTELEEGCQQAILGLQNQYGL